MSAAGQLIDRYSFEDRALVDGERLGAWSVQFSRFAHTAWLRGSEAVMAARLEGEQPAVITVYKDADTSRITTDWRGFDARDASRTFNIRGVTPAKEFGPDFLDILVEFGRADG